MKIVIAAAALTLMAAEPGAAQALQGDRNGDSVDQFLYYQSAASAAADAATQAFEDGDIKAACAALDSLMNDSFMASLLTGPLMTAVREDDTIDEATREDHLQQLRDYDDALNDMWNTASRKSDQYCT